MILLDTHALVWWSAEDSRLSAKARIKIEQELDDSEVLVSSISTWEVAMLVAHSRLVLNTSVGAWIAMIAAIDGVRFIPVDNDIAIASTQLPGNFHKDPADRMIVASARRLNIPLLTMDQKIQAYPHVATIW